jgi:chorismate mutase
MSGPVRAVRGATTLDEDRPDQIDARVRELVAAMVERNGLDHHDLISVIITATPDVRSAFPATPARHLLGDVPLLGAQEMDVDGGMPLCIRVMMHVETSRPRGEIAHVYLHRAAVLQSTGGRQ